MNDGAPDDMWTPFKYLQRTVETSIESQRKSAQENLKSVLMRHKQNFATLLRNPPKNQKNRWEIKQGITEGISLPGLGHTQLSKELVDECIIISDMFDLNEYITIELLCTAQQQMPHHPGLTRGLVAVLLYYDGRKDLATALRDVFQSRSGVSWCTEAVPEITDFIDTFTSRLVNESDILNKIIELLGEMDVKKEIEKLSANRAIGTQKHYRQIVDLFENTRLALAMALFNWSAQSGLPKNVTAHLIEHLSKQNPASFEDNKADRVGLDNVTTALLMALTYSYDTSVLQHEEDGANSVMNLPIVQDSDYAKYIGDALNGEWETNELKSLGLFAFAVSLATLKQAPHNLISTSLQILETDCDYVNKAIELKVFDFIHDTLLENDIVFNTEFFYRRIHILFTDFIELMHSTVMELRFRAIETDRLMESHSHHGVEMPPNLCHNFKSLLLVVGKLYKNDRLKLALSVEYWGPMDVPSNYSQTPTRSVYLYKFLRLAGEVMPTNLFTSYLKMLAGLSNCEQSARNTFNYLKQGHGITGSETLSWDHFFSAFKRYLSALSLLQSPDVLYQNRVMTKSISPSEISGLQAVLELIENVADNDEVARITFCEQKIWSPISIFTRLLKCSFPITLKAGILRALAALGKSKETAFQLWSHLESSQIISTIRTSNTFPIPDIGTEIEKTESRNEVYPLAQAVLDLLYNLCVAGVPKNLGGVGREPGLDPYLAFVTDRVFLKIHNRSYKNPGEKWLLAEKCLRLFDFFLQTYEIHPSNFQMAEGENSTPGFHLMIQLNSKSEILRSILSIIDEACANLDAYVPFSGKENLERCSLYCLKILEQVLAQQYLFFDAHSVSSSSVLMSGLNKLLLGVNPLSGKPDHVLLIANFVTYNSWLPEHALISVKILTHIVRLPNVNQLLLGLFTENEAIRNKIRHGFVECLESDSMSVESTAEGKDPTLAFESGIKEAIINLLQDSLTPTAPNFAHYLLGFDTTNVIRNTQLQQPGILDFPSNCSRSLISLLDKNLELNSTDMTISFAHQRLINKAYELLFSLCYNARTSAVILRFLRACNDFLCRHVAALPFRNDGSSEVLEQMALLLKCAAIELKILAEKSQMSQFNNLCRILLGEAQGAVRESTPLDLSNLYPGFTGRSAVEFKLTANTDVPNSGILLCNLLKLLDFEKIHTDQPDWKFLDISLTNSLLNECKVKDSYGNSSIDIQKLHQILKGELNSVQARIASGQRQIILQETDSILRFAMTKNTQKNILQAYMKFVEAWAQVTEVLFCVASPDSMPYETKQDLIFNVIQALMGKIAPIDMTEGLCNITSSTILVLLVNLSVCFANKKLEDIEQQSAPIATTNLIMSSQLSYIANTNISSIRYILENIIQWIIESARTASQQVRVNLYASLLNMFQITNGNIDNEAKGDLGDQFVSRLDRSVGKTSLSTSSDEVVNLKAVANDAMSVFGIKIIDHLCSDAIHGHDICRIIAMSCIDTLFEMYSVTKFLQHISHFGYLSKFIDGLMKSDKDLCRVLEHTQDNLRPLYVYNSVMSMFSRFGRSRIGAELLLSQQALGVLSKMNVFNLHPDFQVKTYANLIQSQSFIPSVESRYLQILLPALNLCDTILSTAGSENHSAISQVIHFILSHSDTVEMVLRAGSPLLPLELLKELSGITGLIARTASQDLITFSGEQAIPTIGADLYRLQKLMLALLPRFVVSEKTFRQMLDNKVAYCDPNEASKTSEQVIYFLEIASNLTNYCYKAIANTNTDQKCTAILFSPSISKGIQNNETGSGVLEITPSLGILISQLKACVAHYTNQNLVLLGLIRQKQSLQNIGFDPNAQNKYKTLITCLNQKQIELTQCRFIAEQCLYILWAHLDFFMMRAVPLTTFMSRDSFIPSPTEAGWRGTSEDLSSLKKSLIALFNETFCKQLVSITKHGSTDQGFAEAMLRRIKRLIQFVPVN